jgi:hypothetical protein
MERLAKEEVALGARHLNHTTVPMDHSQSHASHSRCQAYSPRGVCGLLLAPPREPRHEGTHYRMIPRCCGLFRSAVYGFVALKTDTCHDGAVTDFTIDHDLEVSDLKRVALPVVEEEEEPPLRIDTVNCGLPLVAHAWTNAVFRWEVELTSPQLKKCFPDRPKPVGQSYATQPTSGILKRDPVDTLITDHSKDDGQPPRNACSISRLPPFSTTFF